MRVSRLKTSLFFSFFLLTFLSLTITVRADDDNDDQSDDYDVKARVARISLIGGEVNLRRNGNKDWETARANYPLVEGDTIATGKGSQLEIQIDSRNFVRLTDSAMLRIVTLRDEGVALSLIEGTLVLRLANFDRDKEYFEIDAPKSTLAAEKKGLYRIDAPNDGRVRLTVRDGGQARIYSDTSGFTLRDERTAELIPNGENAGDWDFYPASQVADAVDEWVKQREQYFALRQKSDVKYFDEYVFGAEDLDAYGDWVDTSDYGWVWRPRSSELSVYSDWAPYRYGHWTWCPPYGWTWVGYEPWGWAPYHYGRWVYYNGYWAWCPRSQYYRKRSWWRPALVAFVFDFSFGNNICWYPLNYYQHDPHSRRYGHGQPYRHPNDGHNGRPNERGPSADYKNWRGVTRVPRSDFGNPNRRGVAVDDESIARRVIEREPDRDNLPNGNREAIPGRSASRLPVMELPDRPTGAGNRNPGATLDDDLRRSRVFRGREPRHDEPRTPAQTNSGATPVTETQPTGAVNRSEPQGGRRNNPGQPETPAGSDQPRTGESPERGRYVRPAMPEGVEKRSRGQQAIENQPRNNPQPRSEPRNDQPVARPESVPERRPEPRVVEPSRPQKTFEPRSEPRREAPRSEAPRNDPPARHDSPPPRNDPPPPRNESPRNESPRNESPRSESPRSESPKSAPAKPDRPNDN
jgi:hypothetical protein